MENENSPIRPTNLENPVVEWEKALSYHAMPTAKAIPSIVGRTIQSGLGEGMMGFDRTHREDQNTSRTS